MYIYVENGRVSGKEFVFAVFSGTGAKSRAEGPFLRPASFGLLNVLSI